MAHILHSICRVVPGSPQVGRHRISLLRFHPERRKIVVIGNRSTTATAISNQIKAAIADFHDRPEIEFVISDQLQPILYQARAVADDAIFYFIPFYMDYEGERYSANDILGKLYQATDAPIYSNWEFMLGSGIVGGKVLSGFVHGAVAGDLLVRVLTGESIDGIPIQTPHDEPFMFDNKMLKRFNISTSDLPPESQTPCLARSLSLPSIINRPTKDKSPWCKQAGCRLPIRRSAIFHRWMTSPLHAITETIFKTLPS